MRVERNGFTLLELLVALAVFAIAALALLQMEGASIARTADLDQRLLREIVAQNMAAEILTDPAPPAAGAATGVIENAGRRFGGVEVSVQEVDVTEVHERVRVPPATDVTTSMP